MKVTGFRNPQLTASDWNSLPEHYRLEMMRNKYTFEFDDRETNQSKSRRVLTPASIHVAGPAASSSSMRFKMRACRKAIYRELISRLMACDGLFFVREREDEKAEGYNVIDIFFDEINDVQHIAGFMSVSFDPENFKEIVGSL